MKCRFYGCKLRAVRYMVPEIRITVEPPRDTSNIMAHPYCMNHYFKIDRRINR